MNTQRSSYIRKHLPAERIRQLESIRAWSWQAHADTWEATFAELARAMRDKQRARLPVHRSLHRWAVKQRTLHNQGRLDGKRAARLASLPGWSWDAREQAWEHALEQLQAFVRAVGHSRPAHARPEAA